MQVQSKLLHLSTALLISIALCSCATRHTEIVYSSLAPHDDALDSAITIATNEPIRVTVGDTVSEKDIGGYLAVPPSDMIVISKELERLRDGEGSR